jgi:transposase
MGTVEMLEGDFGIGINLNSVYRMMDKIDEETEKGIQNISYNYTAKILPDKVNVIFVDATTLYFESFESDNLRQNGYSKDLKFKETQLLFAILVTEEGLPVGYQVFPGSTYEGGILIPILKDIKNRYDLGKVIFVADSGFMNNENLKALEKNGFEYIVGARIKNLPKKITEEILNKENYVNINDNKLATEDDFKITKLKHNNRNLIVSYSEKRARKDAHERQKNIEKLMKKVDKNGRVKDLMGNYGYKKYIDVQTDEKLEINQEKINKDEKWDGLHGVITNSKDLSNQEVLEYYNSMPYGNILLLIFCFPSLHICYLYHLILLSCPRNDEFYHNKLMIFMSK